MIGMDITQIPLFAMLRGRMGYLAQRQQVISENVANSDTPGFVPKDLKPFNFQAQVQTHSASSGPTVTHAGHIQPASVRGGGASGTYKEVASRDSETTLNGNAVVLEEEMLKLSDARMNYDAAIGFYQKSLSLLRMAARAPGR
jgi:flagellar basal-body rod protein FlgB